MLIIENLLCLLKRKWIKIFYQLYLIQLWCVRYVKLMFLITVAARTIVYV